MSAWIDLMPSVVDRIKATLVGLRMPRAFEIVDVIVHQLERGEVSALEAIDASQMRIDYAIKTQQTPPT